MKKLLGLLLFIASSSFAQEKKGDEILGTWLTGSKNAKVEITKNGTYFQGKIVWLSEPIDPITNKAKTDTKHPDINLHNRPLLGLTNIWGFKFEANNNSYTNGHIYDPKNGKEYKSIMTLKDNNTLDVRGYIGITLIGRTDIWTRVK
jgi:uncharacterized protein (DUF2147 family)